MSVAPDVSVLLFWKCLTLSECTDFEDFLVVYSARLTIVSTTVCCTSGMHYKHVCTLKIPAMPRGDATVQPTYLVDMRDPLGHRVTVLL